MSRKPSYRGSCSRVEEAIVSRKLQSYRGSCRIEDRAVMAETITFIVIVYTGFKQNEHIRSGRMGYFMNVHALIGLLIASTCVPVTCNLF